jgi:HEPN domain-containing protein
MNISEAKRWLEYAETDIKSAYALLDSDEFFPRQICFSAQQAGEKALKAVLVLLEIKFPHTHDLDLVREMIPEGWEVRKKFPKLYDLSVWAVESRYPGNYPDVVEYEAREVLLLAEAIYDAVKEEMEAHIQQNPPEEKA